MIRTVERPQTAPTARRTNLPTGWQALHEYTSHQVPLGAVILDAKYCEFCGCNFLRRSQSPDRYCFTCLLMLGTVNPHEIERLVPELTH